jgi:molybdate transport system substrate-binding protein
MALLIRAARGLCSRGAFMIGRFAIAATALSFAMTQASTQTSAVELRVISGGAFKSVLTPMAAEFEKQTGDKVNLTFRTVGQNVKAVEGGETFDVAVLTPEAIDALAKDGKVVAGSRADLAKTGVGVVVKEGAPLPDISTVDAFKRTLLAAKSVAYIDPAAGGSSGIYVGKLLERLGIAKEVNAKALLVQGGAVAEHIAKGEAEVGVHQISEILHVKGAVLVGPLPNEIQNFTIYSAGIGAGAKQADAAKALVEFLSGPLAAPIIRSRGMDRP